MPDAIVMAASMTNPWTRRRKTQLADLVNESWVMLKSNSPLWPTFIDAFHASGLRPPRATVTVSSFHVRITLKYFRGKRLAHLSFQNFLQRGFDQRLQEVLVRAQ